MSSSRRASRLTSPRCRSINARRHPEYYLSHANVVVRVENTLFRVDLSVLSEKSPVFKSIFPLEPPAGASVFLPGFSDARPLELREDTAEDFERLLWMLYPSQSPIYRATNAEEWISILRMANKYGIADIRALAVEQLKFINMDPVQKIVTWNTFGLDPTQLKSAFVALCQRPKSLPLEVAAVLGLVTFTKVVASREMYLKKVGCTKCKKMMSAENMRLLAEVCVEKVFKASLSGK